MVHKDKPGLSKEKGKQKPNPTENVTALVYGGQICERFTSHELQILVSIPPKSSQKKKNRGRKGKKYLKEGNSHLGNILPNHEHSFHFQCKELLFFQGTERKHKRKRKSYKLLQVLK